MWTEFGRLAVCAVFSLLLMSACVSDRQQLDRPVLVPESSLESWSLQGRLAVSNGRDGGSGELSWEQRGEQSDLQFVGAFGRGSWRLRVSPGQAVLELADGTVYQARDIDALVHRHFGWEFPVTALGNWVLGRPAPGTADIRRDQINRLELLSQNGWLVQFEGYHELDKGALPRKITATRDGDRVRLLIREWRI